MSYTLITGASEGIGKEIARRAVKDGKNLVLAARSEDKLKALADELMAAEDVDVVVIPADLTTLDESERLWKAATDGRVVDVLVNNAGLGFNGPFAGDGWDRELTSIKVNLITATDLMRRAVMHMKEHGKGRILNVASTAGFMPGPGMAVYHATKAYILYLSEAVAEELRGTDITVTALCPGATATEFFNEADMGNVRLINMGMLSTAKDVADDGWTAMRIGKRVVVSGLMNKIFAMLPRFFPRSVVVWIAKQFLARSH